MERLILTLLTAVLCTGLQARDVTPLSEGWSAKPISHNQQNQQYSPVTVPHTWNAEYLPGTTDYNRETYAYRLKLDIPAGEKRHFLYFEGVNSYCEMFVNYKYVTSHKGGYTAFCVEITDFVTPGQNDLELWVSNAYRSDVLPLIGDFNVCGGIHRPCRLITTGKECIKPDFYASPGLFVHQKDISADTAELELEALVSAADCSDLQVRFTLTAPDGSEVSRQTVAASASTRLPLSVAAPALWNGKKGPNLYKAKAELLKDGAVIDEVEVTTGFRSLAADSEQGIILNGEPCKVHGYCRHEDFAHRGSALLPEDYERDFQLIHDSGANGLRLAHYPHAECVYDFADRDGILVWSEIPMCGPGGWQFAGYVDTPEFKDCARQNLRELVYQKYNHPSICFWGIFNEIIYADGQRFYDYGDPAPFVRELNALYKELDPTRLTTFATCEDETHYLGCADLVAWNKYFGWYSPDMSKAQAFWDKVHANCGSYPAGISEYGAGGSIYHHVTEVPANFKHSGKFHPEEKQSLAHEANWAIIRDCPWMWGTFIWNFADFRSCVRDEGDTPGINDKGLVTYDRSVCKDAYWFYKAEWNPEPMVYITSRRFAEREEAQTCVKVYSNLPKATLYLNGKKVGEARNDGMSRIIWEGLTLREGDNEIKVVAKSPNGKITDSCIWTLK